MKSKNLILFAIALCAAAFASAASLTLQWQDNSTSEKGFQVQRAAGASPAEADFALVQTTAADATIFLDQNVEPGRSYSYRVRAFDGVQFSDWSNVAVGTLAAPLNPPGNLKGEQTPLVVVTIPAGGSMLVTAGPAIAAK